MSNQEHCQASTASRILLISTSYPCDAADWRGVFIKHMVDALVRANNIQLTVWAPPGELPAAATAATNEAEKQWLAGLMSSGGISHLIRQGRIKSILAVVFLLRMLAAAYHRARDTDLYHINWLQCALPLPNDRKPALITVLGNDLKLLRIPFMRQALRRALRRRKAVICPNAEWMVDPLTKAFGDIAHIAPVSFGIDPCWYAIERAINPSQASCWLAVTRLTANKLGPLFDWSQRYFANNKRELHLFGPMQEDIEVPHWVHYHGAATPEQLATEWFPHAMGLITLSHHAEGRPQVMLEAMASGLPIIASRMTAHASIINDEVTGMLCDDQQSYEHAIVTLEDPTTNRRLGTAAREWAMREFGTWDDCAQRYIRIYQSLLEKNDFA